MYFFPSYKMLFQRLLPIGICLLIFSSNLQAQNDSLGLWRKKQDTSNVLMNLDAIYNRPFLSMGKFPASLGGYVEANSSYFGTDGLTEGLSFQMPRMTLFVAASIQQRIRFLAELELEEGGKEIALEFASMDVEIAPMLNLRGGIIMNPIGSFNQNHDGPKWEVVDRPLVSTEILPATWSNVGFGCFGKLAKRQWVWAYEAYLTNGFDNQIISNAQNRTWLAASKDNDERFTESFNGVPLATVKGAVRNRKWGEVGISWMGGVYNQFQLDGLVIDKRRRMDAFAFDYDLKVPFTKTQLKGELAFVQLDIPPTYTQQYGNKQVGGYMDIIQPLWGGKVLSWENSVINAVVRLEYVDYNVGKFKETNGNIADDIHSTCIGLSFRPSSQTVLRMGYTYRLTQDILGNPAARTAGIQVGFSTYF